MHVVEEDRKLRFGQLPTRLRICSAQWREKPMADTQNWPTGLAMGERAAGFMLQGQGVAAEAECSLQQLMQAGRGLRLHAGSTVKEIPGRRRARPAGLRGCLSRPS